MNVIIDVGIILATVGIGFGLSRYNKYLETQFGDSMFTFWKTLLLLITQICVALLIILPYIHVDLQLKTKIILISVAVAFFLLVLVLNIHTFDVPHGVAVTMLQLFFAVIELVLFIWSIKEEPVYIFAFIVVVVVLILVIVLAIKGSESSEKTDTQSNTVTTTQNTLVDEFNEDALIASNTYWKCQ